jgi:DNA transformation protein
MSEYTQYLQEVFELFGPIQVRKMFGGYGLYHNQIMFALVAEHTIYLKADAENVHLFHNAGLAAFEYNKNGKPTKMSYYRAPDEIMDDHEQACVWAKTAYQAALRSQRLKKETKKRR